MEPDKVKQELVKEMRLCFTSEKSNSENYLNERKTELSEFLSASQDVLLAEFEKDKILEIKTHEEFLQNAVEEKSVKQAMYDLLHPRMSPASFFGLTLVRNCLKRLDQDLSRLSSDIVYWTEELKKVKVVTFEKWYAQELQSLSHGVASTQESVLKKIQEAQTHNAEVREICQVLEIPENLVPIYE